MVIAGDISWAMKLEDRGSGFCVYPLVCLGKSCYLKGNHDYWWSYQKKIGGFFGGIAALIPSRIVHNNAVCSGGDREYAAPAGGFITRKHDEDIKIVNREVGTADCLSAGSGNHLGMKPVVFLHYPPVYDDQ